MSYHVEMPMFGFKELPDRILVREDGAYGDHKAHNTPIVDYWYVLEQRIPPTEREIISAHLEQLEVDNAKLRELIGMIGNVCDGTSEACEYCKNYSATNDECMMLKQMRELGVDA